MAPVYASRLLKKGVYPLSRSAPATCISCARGAIPVSWSRMAKPPSWGSMPVIKCSLSVQTAGPRRRRSVSRRDQSGGTRPSRRLHERSHRASSAVSSRSQPSRIGIAAGSAGAARAPGCTGAMGCGEPVPSGAHREARGPAPRGWTLVGPHRRSPGPLRVPPHCRLRGWPPGAGGARRTGRAMGTSVPSIAGCWRPPPCRLPGLQRALRATPGVPALPRLCSTCLQTGGISLDPWPLAPGGAAPTSGWRPPSLVRRAGWPLEPCVAPTRGPGRLHRQIVSRAQARDSGQHHAVRLPAAALASPWSRFGDGVCASIAGRRRLVASGTLWSGPPAGALGRQGCAAAGHTPGLAARALSFTRTWSRRAWCSPSRSALTSQVIIRK